MRAAERGCVGEHVRGQETVLCAIENGRARLTLSHPARLNALTLDMRREREAPLARMEADALVRRAVNLWRNPMRGSVHCERVSGSAWRHAWTTGGGSAR
jgi:hypothetical protein